jgi:AraC-like DNA-binding protein/quercetin dioxygenase-like cupin family protein
VANLERKTAMRALTGEETQEAIRSHGLDRPTGVGFSFLDAIPDQLYDWHVHAYHQLLYAADGTALIETEDGRSVVPRARAGWIPAGTRHRSLQTGAEAASIFFAPETVADMSSRVRILIADPLMREMILFATRWEKGASETDPLAASFLTTLSLLCGRWLESELPLFLPTSTHPAIRRAMDYVTADPATATQRGAADVALMSERTFRRVFSREAGQGWQAWLTQARILKAMSLLVDGHRVTSVAAEVGYNSISAFAKVFATLVGEAPAQFRQRYCR